MPKFTTFNPAKCRQLPDCEYASLLLKLPELRRKQEAALEASRTDKDQIQVEEALAEELNQLGRQISAALEACELAGSLGQVDCLSSPPTGRGRKI